MWSDKRVQTISIAIIAAALAVGCSSSTSNAGQQDNHWDELEAHADSLYGALEQVAESRNLPIARRDETRRRLTSAWIEEDASTRKRYFLSVFLHPSGIAVRAHIVRESLEMDDQGPTVWREQPTDEEISAEEGAIVEEAHQIWLDDDR